MVYSHGRLEPESRVTQDAHVRPKKKMSLKESRKEVAALEAANRSLRISNLTWLARKGGFRDGFFAGLMVGLVSGSSIAGAILWRLI